MARPALLRDSWIETELQFSVTQVLKFNSLAKDSLNEEGFAKEANLPEPKRRGETLNLNFSVQLSEIGGSAGVVCGL